MILPFLNKNSIAIGFLLLSIVLVKIVPVDSLASSVPPNQSELSTSKNESTVVQPWHKMIEYNWSGYVKTRGSMSLPDDDSFYKLVGTEPYYDGSAEFRLMSEISFGNWGYFEIHYETVFSGGDTRSKNKEGMVISRPVEDDRRVMDLTRTICENDDYILYDRLDRLSLTYQPKWGTICLGRQAVTWGNGFVFNPMDLFNPFSPTDIDRDYKTGDDMVSAQILENKIGEFQFLYVPRRDPENGDVKWDHSSLAGKLHFARGTTEFDIMAARHFEDFVIGIGSTGYLGNAAWRLDSMWTFLNEDSDRDGYLSLVANMDYSWVWWGKNLYGFLELYFNGLGRDNYADAITDPAITERLDRGELFTLGRTYLCGQIRVELHPLFNVYLTAISNLADPSGIVQPWAVWDIAEGFQITFGGNLYYGRMGTEYGGFEIPGTNFLFKTPDSAFLWLTYFF